MPTAPFQGSDRAIENTPAQTKDDNIYDIDLVSDSDDESEAPGITNKRVTRQEASGAHRSLQLCGRPSHLAVHVASWC